MLYQQLVYGITIGSTYALIAVGFSLIFGVLGLINFANGAFVLTGAYLTILFVTRVKLPALVSIPLAMLACGVLGYSMERFCLRPIRNRGQSGISALICTVGISMILVNTIIFFFGSEAKSFPNILRLGSFRVGKVVVTWLNVLILVTSLIIMILLLLLVHKTELGTAIRATSQNRTAARLMGIDVNAVTGICFFLGNVCVSLAGILIGMSYSAVDTGMAFQLSIKTFAAAVLGGIGNLPGALIGGLIIGIAESLVAGYVGSNLRDVVAFIVLLLVLFFKPTGIFGRKSLEKV